MSPCPGCGHSLLYHVGPECVLCFHQSDTPICRRGLAVAQDPERKAHPAYAENGQVSPALDFDGDVHGRES